ncbi:MAG: hypothetical protein DWH78_00145 [Planctomycetota bacterium]|nr:MAG: hypothetical protein DWH78_00145 [Planctomycetota bacterium]
MTLGQVEHTIASPPVRCIQADELAAYQSLIHSGLTALIYGVFRVEGKPRRLSISWQFDCDDFDLIFKSKYNIHFAQRSSIFAEVQSLVERVQIGILCSDTRLWRLLQFRPGYQPLAERTIRKDGPVSKSAFKWNGAIDGAVAALVASRRSAIIDWAAE